MKHRAAAEDRSRLAAGRDLPPLLFVTHRTSLDDNIGGHGATEVLELIYEANLGRERDQRHVVIEFLGPLPHTRESVLAEVHGALKANPQVMGIVLLGGYDVVPSMRVDVLPRQLREWVDRQPLDADDADNWIVWCDDPYGDPELTGIPEVPVSRIPDGCSKELMLAAMCVPKAESATRSGIRNARRPFAERIFAMLPGNERMHVSAPIDWKRLGETALHASHVYIMLHGRNDIGRELWGEVTRDPAPAPDDHALSPVTEELPTSISETREQRMLNSHSDAMVSAVKYDQMPGNGAVILSGCCWSAQASTWSARRARPGYTPKPRRTDTSVAMSALRAGARAFVGSTGVNYSPLNPSHRFYCEPMHREFWHGVVNGYAPAMALLVAKHRYASGMPHGHKNDWTSRAIEHKTLHQYTCLGLGW